MEKEQILIIDDDSRNIFALEANLKVRNFKVKSFLEVKDAIEWLMHNEVRVILLDMMMPEIDGYGAIKLIKALPQHKNSPIVSVTAQAMTGDKERCLEAGADDYVSKPIDMDILLEIIAKY